MSSMCSRSAPARVRDTAAEGSFVISFKICQREARHRLGRKRHSAFDVILEFANIAGPVVRLKHGVGIAQHHT